MDSTRKPDDEEQPDGGQPGAADGGQPGAADGDQLGAPDEDHQAILSRRTFLIESALASAGITVGLTGCERLTRRELPEVCLSVAPTPRDAGSPRPQECLKVAPRERTDICLKVAPPKERTDVCLRVAPPKPRPGVCLSVAPRRTPDGGVPPRPQPCLKPVPRPQPCLSVRQPDPKKSDS